MKKVSLDYITVNRAIQDKDYLDYITSLITLL